MQSQLHSKLQVDVQSQNDVEELQGVLGLALQLDTGGKELQSAAALHLPCQAPFTSMLPDTMRLAHRSVPTLATLKCQLITVGLHVLWKSLDNFCCRLTAFWSVPW